MDARLEGIPEALAITSRRSGDLVIIAVSGEPDLGNVGLLDQAIREAEEGDGQTIFLDEADRAHRDRRGIRLSELIRAAIGCCGAWR